MNYTDVKAFFTTLADDNDWGFAHNSEHLEQKVGHKQEWKDRLVLTMDEPRGTLRYNGRFYDQPSYGFWLVRKVPKDQWEKEDEYYEEAKTAFITIILAAINEQMEDQEGVFAHFEGGADYTKAGPMTQERLFGIYVSFGAEGAINL